jgi:C1A family cysteine protease
MLLAKKLKHLLYLNKRNMAKQHKLSYLINRLSGKRIKLGACHLSKQLPPKAKKYDFSRFQANNLPARVDLRSHMTRVENQGAVGSCTANAIAGAYEYLAKRALGESGDISRLFIYYNARKLDGIKGDKGSCIASSIQVLEEIGACTEETWAYDPNRVLKKPSQEAYDEAQYFLVEEADQVDVDLYAMKHCLAEGYPFAFGLKLFKPFDKAAKQGSVPMPNPSGEDGREEHGMHAMLCVGYSDKSQAFIVRNSWGEDWGDRGYCYIPYDYMANTEYCFDCWTIRTVSDLDFSAGVWVDDDDTLYDFEESGEEDYNYEYVYESDDEEEDEESESDEEEEEEDEETEANYDDESDESDDEEYDDQSDEEEEEEEDEETEANYDDESDKSDEDEESEEEDEEEYADDEFEEEYAGVK